MVSYKRHIVIDCFFFLLFSKDESASPRTILLILFLLYFHTTICGLKRKRIEETSAKAPSKKTKTASGVCVLYLKYIEYFLFDSWDFALRIYYEIVQKQMT